MTITFEMREEKIRQLTADLHFELESCAICGFHRNSVVHTPLADCQHCKEPEAHHSPVIWADFFTVEVKMVLKDMPMPNEFWQVWV